MFERSELLFTPTIKFSFWKQGDKGCLFFDSVSFGNAKEMNAQRRAYDFKIKTRLNCEAIITH
ncbi:hypothetical protein LCGC14_2190820, partial [marine sediment metagenome]